MVSLYVFDVGDESLSLILMQNIYDGMYRSQRVCLKVLKVLTSGDPARVAKVCCANIVVIQTSSINQAFCRKALLWRQLHHPRILPLLCMTPYTRPRFCLVSPWMHNGNVNQFLRKHPTSDKLKMVSIGPHIPHAYETNESTHSSPR